MKYDSEGLLIVNKSKCKTCIFNCDQKIISLERLAEIQKYLLEGNSHICHITENVCRGSREYQAEIFYRMRLIDEPTIEVLNKRIKQAIK